MARMTGIFPCWTGFSSGRGKKSGEFEGKIRLAHQRQLETRAGPAGPYPTLRSGYPAATWARHVPVPRGAAGVPREA